MLRYRCLGPCGKTDIYLPLLAPVQILSIRVPPVAPGTILYWLASVRTAISVVSALFSLSPGVLVLACRCHLARSGTERHLQSQRPSFSAPSVVHGLSRTSQWTCVSLGSWCSCNPLHQVNMAPKEFVDLLGRQFGGIVASYGLNCPLQSSFKSARHA